MKARDKKQSLSLHEWDFRQCPENERATCLHYEYAREYVWERPALAEKLASGFRPPPYDHFLKFIYSDKAHPDSLPLRRPGFPDAAWLSLRPTERVSLIEQCQLLPEKDASNSNLLVEDEFNVGYLQELDELRKDLSSKWLKEVQDLNGRQAISSSSPVGDNDNVSKRPPLCNGPKRFYAVDEFTALAVIRLDWRKSKRDLKAAFARLLERYPEKMLRQNLKPPKGGRGGLMDQLKKLGARRLRFYYGSSEAALEAIQSAYSKTRYRKPYTDGNALDKAAAKAGNVLEWLEDTGRFRSFADL